MSYLDYPRLHFSGGFLADPSTINNTPNNYDDDNQETKELELYWNPNGTGIFDFHDCKVTKVVYAPGEEATTPEEDPIIGQTVAAVYTSAHPKLVDLDPDQQNVSEIWGLTLQVGGTTPNPSSIANLVRGDYVEGAFNAIWAQAHEGPPNSSSGAGVYQSQLKNLVWDIESAPKSKYLTALEKASPEQLSINFVVNAHNNAPPIYAFNTETFNALKNAPNNVPQAILDQLLPMQSYAMMKSETLGNIPTESYVNHEVTRLLGETNATTYLPLIREVTRLPYPDNSLVENVENMPTTFPNGLVTGTIGPQVEAQPIYYTPSRTLAPTSSSICYFAPFKVFSNAGKNWITLNVGNALAMNKPGFDVANDRMGRLTIGYFDQDKAKDTSLDNFVPVANLPTDLASVLENSAGIIDLKVDASILPKEINADQANQNISSMPLGIFGDSEQIPWLAENVNGYNVRADQFVFRMNAGIETSDTQPMGNSAEVSLYVTQFGKPVENVALETYKLCSKAAFNYTVNTPGTGGTAGIKNLSIPQKALRLIDPNTAPDPDADPTAIVIIKTDANGKAILHLEASNPGNPRGDQNLDGQVYFIKYNFADGDISKDFIQDENDLVSVQVYGQPNIPAVPTWKNCIKNILPQYAKLYPIMGRFKLDDYQVVYKYRETIADVLARPMNDPMHMPVIRDLSNIRKNAVLDWIANGAPEQ